MAGKVFIKDGMNLREEHLLGLYTIQAEGAFTFDDLRVTFDVNQNKVKVVKGRYWLKNSGGDGLNEPAYYLIGLDTDEFLDEPTTSSKRMDAVVVYLDRTTLVGSGGGGVVHVVIVQGTEGTTNPPSASDIENVVGTSNPYAILAYLRLQNGVSLSDENIIEMRKFYTMNNNFAGKKNYLVNSDFYYNRFGFWTTDWAHVDLYAGNNCFEFVGATDSDFEFGSIPFPVTDEPDFLVGKELLFSGFVENVTGGDSTMSMKVFLKWYDGSNWFYENKKFIVYQGDKFSGKRFFIIKFEIKPEMVLIAPRIKIYASSNPATYRVCKLKLELGNMPTPYVSRNVRPAPISRITIHDGNIITDPWSSEIHLSELVNYRAVGALISLHLASDNNDTDFFIDRKENGTFINVLHTEHVGTKDDWLNIPRFVTQMETDGLRVKVSPQNGASTRFEVYIDEILIFE